MVHHRVLSVHIGWTIPQLGESASPCGNVRHDSVPHEMASEVCTREHESACVSVSARARGGAQRCEWQRTPTTFSQQETRGARRPRVRIPDRSCPPHITYGVTACACMFLSAQRAKSRRTAFLVTPSSLAPGSAAVLSTGSACGLAVFSGCHSPSAKRRASEVRTERRRPLRFPRCRCGARTPRTCGRSRSRWRRAASASCGAR